MTDKEAVKVLESMNSDDWCGYSSALTTEAINVAIKALNWRDHQQHSHWKDDGTCSMCGQNPNCLNVTPMKSNFCPQCGRQMFDIVKIKY